MSGSRWPTCNDGAVGSTPAYTVVLCVRRKRSRLPGRLSEYAQVSMRASKEKKKLGSREGEKKRKPPRRYPVTFSTRPRSLKCSRSGGDEAGGEEVAF